MNLIRVLSLINKTWYHERVRAANEWVISNLVSTWQNASFSSRVRTRLAVSNTVNRWRYAYKNSISWKWISIEWQPAAQASNLIGCVTSCHSTWYLFLCLMPKLTSSMISDIKPIIYIYIYAVISLLYMLLYHFIQPQMYNNVLYIPLY